jgi:hypothetical protein
MWIANDRGFGVCEQVAHKTRGLKRC